jgi:RNA polymerase sigma-70 factor (ECF subfamily)
MSDATPDGEHEIREAFREGKLEAAATATLDRYGDEIFSFLVSRLREVADAEEAFSMFAEDLWVGLPKFGWRSSMRTWAYMLARNAAARYASAPARRAARNLSLSAPGAISDIVQRVRSATQIHQQTAVKDRVRALRDRLDPDDQMLLVLRVDRGMAWRDLAITITGNADLEDTALEREATRLRKAFERVKAELKQMASDEGLLKSGE